MNVEITKVLEHRYPFIMVDKIVEIIYGEKVRGIKNVSHNEPWIQGHFPDVPIMPGVLIIEAMAQVGGFAFYDEDKKNGVKGYICAIDKVKFIEKVVPGDILIIDGIVQLKMENLARVKLQVRVDEKIVALGEVSYAFK